MSASHELAKTETQLAHYYAHVSSGDADRVEALAADLDETATTLSRIAGDLGIEGTSADAAWEAFDAVVRDMRMRADEFTAAASAARTAYDSLMRAKAAYQELPAGAIDGAIRTAITVGGRAVAGPTGELVGDAAVDFLDGLASQARETAAARALGTLSSEMVAARSDLPAVQVPNFTADVTGPVDIDSLFAPGGGGSAPPSSPRPPRTVLSPTAPGGGGAVSDPATPPGTGGPVLPPTGDPTGGPDLPPGNDDASSDDPMTPYVPLDPPDGDGGAGGGGGVGGGGGGIGGGTGGSGISGGAGGVLGGGLAIGGVAAGALGLGRGGLGLGAGGLGTAGGAGAAGMGMVGGAGGAGGAGGRGGGLAGGRGSGLAGSRSSGLAAGGSSTTGGAAGGRGAAMAGGAGGAGGGAGSASKKRRRGGAGYLGPDVEIEDDAEVVDLGAGARAGGRGAGAVVAEVDDLIDDDTW